MTQDPLSHVASWISPTLDAGAARFMRADSSEERPATAEELAAIEFEGVDATACRLLYKGMTTQETIMFRLASDPSCEPIQSGWSADWFVSSVRVFTCQNWPATQCPQP
jgi:hypothetical protein